MTRETESLLVAFCGADGSSNVTVANALKAELDKQFPTPVELVANIATRLKERGYPVDSETTTDTQWAIEWAWLDAEQRLRNVPKIFCRSVIDRMAYNRVCKLGMDLHFEDILPASLKRYTVLFYTPISQGDESQKVIDSVIRKIIKDYSIPVQLLCGSMENKIGLALEAAKLRLGI